MKITKQDLEKFDEASDHPETCQCEICQKWMDMVPPVEDSDDSYLGRYDEW
jgi:hypothetical protein